MTKKVRIPEGFTKCGLPFGPIYGASSFKGKDSFCERGLNKAGVLILVKGQKSPILIGHINKNGGVCDDCKAFGNEEIVVAYKAIWEEAQ